MAGLTEIVGGIGDFAKDMGVDMFGPKFWYDQFQEGQARDEARGVRAGDIERDEKWLERNSISGRIAEGERNGLSKMASLGFQPAGGAATVGQDTAHLSRNQVTNHDPLVSLNKRLLDAQIKSVELDNLKKSNDLKTPPPAGQPGRTFIPGRQKVKGPVDKPLERTESYPGKPFMINGAVPGLAYEVTPTGLAPVPSSDAKNAIEDSPYELRHFYNYGILPNLGDTKSKPPTKELPRGATDWRWAFSKQEWQPVYPRVKPNLKLDKWQTDDSHLMWPKAMERQRTTTWRERVMGRR